MLTVLQEKMLLVLNDAISGITRSQIAKGVNMPEAIVEDGVQRAEFRNAWNPLKDEGYVCEHAMELDGALYAHLTRRGRLYILNKARRTT